MNYFIFYFYSYFFIFFCLFIMIYNIWNYNNLMTTRTFFLFLAADGVLMDVKKNNKKIYFSLRQFYLLSTGLQSHCYSKKIIKYSDFIKYRVSFCRFSPILNPIELSWKIWIQWARSCTFSIVKKLYVRESLGFF